MIPNAFAFSDFQERKSFSKVSRKGFYKLMKLYKNSLVYTSNIIFLLPSKITQFYTIKEIPNK